MNDFSLVLVYPSRLSFQPLKTNKTRNMPEAISSSSSHENGNLSENIIENITENLSENLNLNLTEILPKSLKLLRHLNPAETENNINLIGEALPTIKGALKNFVDVPSKIIVASESNNREFLTYEPTRSINDYYR